MKWTRHPAEGFAARALSVPGAMLTWSSWSGAWVAWIPSREEVPDYELAAWCERVGVPVPSVEDLDWARGE